jgi:hypothetical protein
MIKWNTPKKFGLLLNIVPIICGQQIQHYNANFTFLLFKWAILANEHQSFLKCNIEMLGPCTLYHWHTKVLSSWVVAILKHVCFRYTSTCKSKDTIVGRCKESKTERQRKWEVEKVGERTIINSKERGRKKRERGKERERERDWTREKTNQSTRFRLYKWDFRPFTLQWFCSSPKQQHANEFFFPCFILLSVFRFVPCYLQVVQFLWFFKVC